MSDINKEIGIAAGRCARVHRGCRTAGDGRVRLPAVNRLTSRAGTDGPTEQPRRRRMTPVTTQRTSFNCIDGPRSLRAALPQWIADARLAPGDFVGVEAFRNFRS